MVLLYRWSGRHTVHSLYTLPDRWSFCTGGLEDILYIHCTHCQTDGPSVQVVWKTYCTFTVHTARQMVLLYRWSLRQILYIPVLSMGKHECLAGGIYWLRIWQCLLDSQPSPHQWKCTTSPTAVSAYFGPPCLFSAHA